MLLNIDLTEVPISVISAIVTLIASYTLIKFQIKTIIKKNEKHSRDIEKIKQDQIKDREAMNNKIQLFKDSLDLRIHKIDINVSRILALLEKKS